MTSRRPRIALLFPTTVLGSYWEALLDELALRCDPHLFTGQPWPGLERRGHDRVTIVGRTRRRFARDSEVGGYGGGLLVPSGRIVGLLLRHRPDVVFSATFSMWTLLVLALRPLLRWRVVILWEGSTPRVDRRESPLRTAYRRALAHRVDAVATNSRAGESYLVDVLDLPAATVHRRPYQLPTTEIWGSPDRPARQTDDPGPLRLLSIGKVVPRKGMHRLFDALDLLQARGVTGWRLTVVGTGSDVELLTRRAEGGGYADRITWAGWVTYEELGPHLRDADVFVFPTLEDTWGMVLLEALAMGLPAISSPWAGASDLVVDGGAGFVCDPHEVDELADHIRTLVQDRSRVALLAAAATDVMASNRPADGASFLVDLGRQLSSAERRVNPVGGS